ncbi:hypothetical protein ACWCYY_34990 [Kitasatospora sp. NPDC001664]
MTTTQSTTAGPGLFGPYADPAPVGDESIEWALWLTATGEQRPTFNQIAALIAASQYAARAALDPGAEHGQAVVLHHGRVWTPDATAVSGAVVPELLWSARCSVCQREYDEENGLHFTVGYTIEQAVDAGWTHLDGGWLVCDESDREHRAARTAERGPAPVLPVRGQRHLPDVVLDDEPVHTWFGLSYSAYLVLPRTLLQSMPASWQQRMVACLRELDETFADVERAQAYDVTPGTVHEVGDLTDAQLRAAGVDVETDDQDDEDDGLAERRFRSRDGDELDRHDTVLLPGREPVPHYNRGRTRLTPAANR